MSRPSLYADVYIDRINLAVSISLGINEAEAIGKSVHFLKTVCGSLLVIFATFYVQSVASRQSRRHHGVFLLVWRMVDKIASFVQQFLTTIVVNILTTKISENDAENKMLSFRSKLMLYMSIVLFLVSLMLVFQWHFYQDVRPGSGQQLPRRLVQDITAAPGIASKKRR